MTQRFRYPEPKSWNDIYSRLLDAHKQTANPKIPKPPVPLILAAWWEATSLEKHEREGSGLKIQ